MARDVSGQWSLIQSNGFEVTFDIVQAPDGRLHGSGTVRGGREANGEGRVDDHSFVFTVDWNNNGRGGRYSGTFDPAGRLSGVTADLDNPTSQATWFSKRSFRHK
ncbi:MAG: hypothetical protein M3198_11655 [Actinomycetota bacterium]|nr:hypothetical protein [Actinomycetota bacterium]